METWCINVFEVQMIQPGWSNAQYDEDYLLSTSHWTVRSTRKYWCTPYSLSNANALTSIDCFWGASARLVLHENAGCDVRRGSDRTGNTTCVWHCTWCCTSHLCSEGKLTTSRVNVDGAEVGDTNGIVDCAEPSWYPMTCWRWTVSVWFKGKIPHHTSSIVKLWRRWRQSGHLVYIHVEQYKCGSPVWTTNAVDQSESLSIMIDCGCTVI